MTWLSTVIFKSSCSINVRYFPFDEQACDMVFASWTFDGFFIDLNVNSKEGDVTNYIKNGEWHLVNLTATKISKIYSCCEEPYPEIHYHLIIRRRPLYYVFNMVFPCLLITLVAFLGFYLPPGSTEKISIGITTLLSLTVFLMLVAESMPPTSEQLPLLGIYYGVTIGLVSFSTAMAVITLNINNRGTRGKKVPTLFRIFFFKYMARILRTHVSPKTKTYIYKPLSKNPKKEIFASKNFFGRANSNPVKMNGNLKKSEELEKILVPGENTMNTKVQHNLKEHESLILESINELSNLKDNKTKLQINEEIFDYGKICKKNSSDRNKILVKARKQTLDLDNPRFSCLIESELLADRSSYNETEHESRNSRYYNKEEYEANQIAQKLEKVFDKHLSPLVNMLVKNLLTNEKRAREKEEMDEIKREWTDIALVADHFLCYFFPSMTLIICLTIFLNSPHTFSQW